MKHKILINWINIFVVNNISDGETLSKKLCGNRKLAEIIVDPRATKII